ncbi:MAG: hypothetical protein ACJAYE_003616 [Candidatus Azotimanducaceae bacterium]
MEMTKCYNEKLISPFTGPISVVSRESVLQGGLETGSETGSENARVNT